MKRKWIKRLLWFGGILLILVLAVFLYIRSTLYTPTTQAQTAAKNAQDNQGTLIFEGDKDKPAVIFYQGALVENESYSIWAQKVAEAGYSVYLVQFPLALAVFSPNKAEKIIQDNHLSDYVIGGHSLGGVMGSRFAASQLEDKHLKGVFFLASYPDEKGSLAAFKGSVLSLTGAKDGVLNWDAYNDAKDYLPEQTRYEQIEGGNHAGFGSYGEQKGDSEPSINNEEQQVEVATILIDWLNKIQE